MLDVVGPGVIRHKGETPVNDDQNLPGRGIGVGDRHDVGADVELLVSNADLALLDALGYLSDQQTHTRRAPNCFSDHGTSTPSGPDSVLRFRASALCGRLRRGPKSTSAAARDPFRSSTAWLGAWRRRGLSPAHRDAPLEASAST